ncbi:YcxB family protein, partial [Pseudoflavonifractor sp. 60]|nr:YcxB family protein [Pseudoflavonifractor sp. 60]
SYKGVQGVYESKTAFFLQLTSGQFLILRKDCFTSGVPDAFRRFIDERGGKPVIII